MVPAYGKVGKTQCMVTLHDIGLKTKKATACSFLWSGKGHSRK